MIKKKSIREKLTPEQWDMILDPMQDTDMISMVLDIPKYKIENWRHVNKYRDSMREASRRYRNKKKEEGIMSKAHSRYNFWKEDEIKYILSSEDSLEQMAIRLGRTICSVQKKLERIRKGNK